MDKKRKKQSKIDSKPIFSLLIGLTLFSIILFVTMVEAAKDTKPLKKISSDKGKSSNQQEDPSAYNQYDGELLAILQEVNTLGRQVTLYDINQKETVILNYTGGSDIKDKYNQVITISQIPIGQIVEVGYQKEISKLMKLQTSDEAWEYIGVSNLSINYSDRIMKIAQTKYKYTEDIIIVDGDSFLTINDLTEQDELTVRGVNETIWSITVTRGHGTVLLTDQDAFLGGNITVGYEAMQQITEDLSITVREGNFNLTVENGEYSGTKNITVYRNMETIVSLSDLGPKAGRQGRVTFDISPFGADLFVDGELTSYANPIELTYGDHSIEVSLGGYTTYKGVLDVDRAGIKLKIDLPEAQSKEEVKVVESGDNSVGEDEQDFNEWEYPTVESEYTSDSDEDTNVFDTDEDHAIFVQNPVGASVYLNGDFIGVSPGSFPKVVGSHVLTFIKEGYETMSYTIEVEDDGLDTYLSFSELAPKEE